MNDKTKLEVINKPIPEHILKANEIVADLLTLPPDQLNEACGVIINSIIQSRQDKQSNLLEQAKNMQGYNDALRKTISMGKMTNNNPL